MTEHKIAFEEDRPLLLDLFCGAGGAAMGYHRAGFDVVGVDIKPQPNYPFEFIQGDALNFIRDEDAARRDFSAVHASPPCQRYTAMKAMWNHKGDQHPDLVAQTRELLEATELPWVMENVPGAPMGPYSIQLCGSMFGLGVAGYELRRHRLFETSFPLLSPACQHSHMPTLGIYGDHARDRRRVSGEDPNRGRQLPAKEALELSRAAMQMPWANWKGLSEAIPPAYTEFIGHQLMSHLMAREVAA